MPCIICQRDHRPSSRIELEDLSTDRRQALIQEHFCNWEFNYICRSCYWRDHIHRSYFSIFLRLFAFFLNFLTLASVTVVTYSSVLWWKVPLPYRDVVPVTVAVVLVLFFYSKFVKSLVTFVCVVGVIICIIYGGVYSDYMALIPPLTVLTDRAKIKEKQRMEDLRNKRNPRLASRGKGKPTTAPPDPGIAYEEARGKARQQKLAYLFSALKPFLPFKTDMRPHEMKHALKLSGYALLIYYVLLLLFRKVITPLLARKKKGPSLRPPLPGMSG